MFGSGTAAAVDFIFFGIWGGGVVGHDWNCHRCHSLTPHVSPVGASVAFAKVQIQFLFCYQQFHISMAGSAIANLSSASEIISGTVMLSTLLNSTDTFPMMFPMQSMGLNICLSKFVRV